MGTLRVSFSFATRGGLMFLDVVDYFNNFGTTCEVARAHFTPFTSLSKSKRISILN